MLPLPWLYAIAGNVISEQRRAERRRLKIIERITAGPASDFATYQQPAAELSAELAKALRKLSDTYRDALLLVAWGELSYDEAAGALGVPVGTVRSRVSRARRQLDRALRPTSSTLHSSSTTGVQHV